MSFNDVLLLFLAINYAMIGNTHLSFPPMNKYGIQTNQNTCSDNSTEYVQDYWCGSMSINNAQSCT